MKYLCYVSLAKIVEADSNEQASEKFMEYHDFEDLLPTVKRFLKQKIVKIKVSKIEVKWEINLHVKYAKEIIKC